MSRATKALLRLLPIALVLFIGIGASVWLVATRAEPERRPLVEPVEAVEVVAAKPTDYGVVVQGYGEVAPAMRVSLQVEVSGRVAWKNERFADGGQVRAGESLLRLDDEEYRLTVEERRAEVESARAALMEEEARARVVSREHALLGELGEEAAKSALARREPQLLAARAASKAAESGLERAMLNLSRARLIAPFDGVILDQAVSLGQTVAPQMELATLIGTDHFWVRAAFPAEDVFRIRPEAPAKVSWSSRRGPMGVYEGEVVRLLGDLDPMGRQARVLLRIEDPLVPEVASEMERPPLLLGAFVDVEVQAQLLEGVFVLPRGALRQETNVFVKGPDERLRIRQVEVVWEERERVVVRDGLRPGELVITSPLRGAYEGMPLRAKAHEEPDGAGRRRGPAESR